MLNMDVEKKIFFCFLRIFLAENDLLHTTDYTVFTCNICDK